MAQLEALYHAYQGCPIESEPVHPSSSRLPRSLALAALGLLLGFLALAMAGAWEGVRAGTVPLGAAAIVTATPLAAFAIYRGLLARVRRTQAVEACEPGAMPEAYALR
jgi:hypothetical protein